MNTFLRNANQPGFVRQCPHCGNSEDLIVVFNGYFMPRVEIGGCLCTVCNYHWTEHAYPDGDVFLAGGYHPGVSRGQRKCPS